MNQKKFLRYQETGREYLKMDDILTDYEIENVADCLREAGFEFDSFHTDNDTYVKIINAVLEGLDLKLEKQNEKH